MSSIRPSPPGPRVRTCQMEGCFEAAISAHIFCGRHAVSAEGIAFNKEIQAAAQYLLATEEAPSEADLARQQRTATFARRGGCGLQERRKRCPQAGGHGLWSGTGAALPRNWRGEAAVPAAHPASQCPTGRY